MAEVTIGVDKGGQFEWGYPIDNNNSQIEGLLNAIPWGISKNPFSDVNVYAIRIKLDTNQVTISAGDFKREEQLSAELKSIATDLVCKNDYIDVGQNKYVSKSTLESHPQYPKLFGHEHVSLSSDQKSLEIDYKTGFTNQSQDNKLGLRDDGRRLLSIDLTKNDFTLSEGQKNAQVQSCKVKGG